MKFIFKNLYFIPLFAVCFLLFANIVSAHQVVETRPAFAETAEGGLSSFHYLAQYQLETALPNVPRVLPAEQMLPNYLNYLFIFGLGIIGIIALGVMIAGGIQYILAAGNMAKTADAKDRILQALFGVGFLLVSYLLLYTINPDLVNLKNPKLGLELESSNDLSNIFGDIGKSITLEELKKADEGAILSSNPKNAVTKIDNNTVLKCETTIGDVTSGYAQQICRTMKIDEIEKELQKK